MYESAVIRREGKCEREKKKRSESMKERSRKWKRIPVQVSMGYKQMTLRVFAQFCMLQESESGLMALIAFDT